MEIERKFLVKKLPEDLATYPCHQIEQGYLCTDPVVRIRRQDHEYYLTYKSAGLMTRSEYNLPLNEDAYGHLKAKTDGNLITKKRYCIPISEYLTVELDIFGGAFTGLVVAEVEFGTSEEAQDFLPLDWFGDEVTWSPKYHNSTISQSDPADYGLIV